MFLHVFLCVSSCSYMFIRVSYTFMYCCYMFWYFPIVFLYYPICFPIVRYILRLPGFDRSFLPGFHPRVSRCLQLLERETCQKPTRTNVKKSDLLICKVDPYIFKANYFFTLYYTATFFWTIIFIWRICFHT